MANKWKHGDVVVLKSGGPPMTVEHVPGEDERYGGTYKDYHCRWFKGADQKTGSFPEILLETFVPPAKK